MRSFARALRSAFRSIARAVRRVFRAIRPFIKVIAAIVIGAKIPAKKPFLKGFVSGTISSGGDLRQGLISGLTAGFFDLTAVGNTLSQIGAVGRTVFHGAVGGLASVASGGNFRSGFIAGAAAKGVTEIAGATGGNLFASGQERIGTLVRNVPLNDLQLARNATISAVIGGTGSALGGGKFVNGAVTGAFSRLYNADSCRSIQCRGRDNGRAIEPNGSIGGNTIGAQFRRFVGSALDFGFDSANTSLGTVQTVAGGATIAAACVGTGVLPCLIGGSAGALVAASGVNTTVTGVTGGTSAADLLFDSQTASTINTVSNFIGPSKTLIDGPGGVVDAISTANDTKAIVSDFFTE